MAIDRDQLRLTILELEADGAAHHGAAITEHVRRSVDASPEELSEVHDSARSVFDNLVDWAKAHMTEHRLHEIVGREGGHNVYKITEEGRKQLAQGLVRPRVAVAAHHRRSRERLVTHFPEARAFLVELEQLDEGAPGGLRITTDVGVQVLFDERLLFSVRIGALTSSRPFLELSPGDDEPGAVADVVFSRRLYALVAEHRGGSGGWARRVRSPGGDALRVYAGAPPEFFEGLLGGVADQAASPRQA